MIYKGTQHSVPTTASSYAPKPIVDSLVWDKDVMAPMRDGVSLCVDVYRPGTKAKFPALLAIAGHNKDLQTPDVAKALPPQPAWSTLWQGGAEAGDSDSSCRAAMSM